MKKTLQMVNKTLEMIKKALAMVKKTLELVKTLLQTAMSITFKKMRLRNRKQTRNYTKALVFLDPNKRRMKGLLKVNYILDQQVMLGTIKESQTLDRHCWKKTACHLTKKQRQAV